MKINSFRIKNLYSFEDEKIDFDNFNIVVGPNGSGKTNIIRSLKSIINEPYRDNYNILYKLESLVNSKISAVGIKLDKRKKSTVMLELKLSNEELKLLFEFIFKRDVEIKEIQNYDDATFTLLVNWPVEYMGEILPDLLIFRFPNGFTFLYEKSSWHNIMYMEQNIIDSFLKDNDTSGNIFKKIKDGYCNEANFNNSEVKEYISVEETPLVIHNEIYNDDPNIFSVIPTYFDFIQQIKEKLHNNKKFIYSMLNDSNDIKEILSASYKLYKSFDHNENNALIYKNRLCLLLSSDIIANFKFPSNLDKKYISDIHNVLFNKKINENSNISGFTPDIWVFLSNLIFSKIIFSNETPDDEKTLAEKLFSLKNQDGPKKNYEELENGFKNIFGKDLDFDVVLSENEKIIKIIEKDKQFKLSDSASGYFDVLSLFTTISNKADSVIILDEPLTRLHHSKQRLVGHMLSENQSNNQTIIITHSSSFINHKMISDNNLIYIKRNDNSSKVKKKEGTDKIPKSHLLNPDIFFSNYVLAVEGPTDEAVFKAISNSMDDLFWTYDVLILNMQNKEIAKKFGKLMFQYDINFIALVDNDYVNKSNDLKYIKKNKIEAGKFNCYPFGDNKSDETKSIYIMSDSDVNMDVFLKNLGYSGENKDIDGYYDFIYNIIKEDPTKIKQTLLFEIIDKIKKTLNIY
ncbi:MAG: AAA family ATPase [bacterium]